MKTLAALLLSVATVGLRTAAPLALKLIKTNPLPGVEGLCCGDICLASDQSDLLKDRPNATPSCLSQLGL